MSKVIKCTLSVDSIDKAIQEIEAYRKSFIEKIETLMDVLLADAYKEAQTRLASTVGDSTNASVTKTVPIRSGDSVVATICLVGEDALFVEFGAGIAYNTGAEHPYASELGYGVGTYPSKHPPNKAINPGRWIYGHTSDHVPLWSIGTGASMPIYYASETIRNNAVKKAKEVFRS